MASCDITPQIINRAGQPVESQLWKDLMKINNNRDWVKRVYEGIHTDYFVNWFGDWINDAEDASLVVDKNGEPKIVSVADVFGELKPAFLSIKDETVYAEMEDATEVEGLAADSYMVIYDEEGGQVDITNQRAQHPDPTIQAAIDKYGPLLINSKNNPYVWAMEDKLGIIDKSQPWAKDRNGVPYRRKISFSLAKAKKLAAKATEEGYPSTWKAAYNTKTGKSNKYLVVVTKDISQQTSSKNRVMQRFAGFKEQNENFKDRFRVIFDQQEKLTDLEKLHVKVTEAFEKRIAIMEKQYDFIQRQDFQEFLDEYLESNNVTNALVSAVLYSAKITSQLFNRYRDMQESGEPLTARGLQTWSDFLTAYDTLDELQNLILKDPSIIQDPAVTKALQDSITKKNFLRDLYQTEGIKILAEWLTPHYNGIYKEFEDKKKSEYRREYHKKKKGREYSKDVIKEGETEKEYVGRFMEKHAEELRQRTETLLLKELQTASRDISELTRWIDNILDTSDPVAAAVVNAFVEADEKSRAEAIRKRTDIIKAVTAYESTKGKGAMESEIKFYESFLEFDEDGVPNQHLARPWLSSIIEEEKKQRIRIYKRGEEEDPDFIEELKVKLKRGEIDKERFQSLRRGRMHEMMDQWRQHHVRIFEEERDEALMEYMKSLVDKIDEQTGKIIIDEDQYSYLENNLKYVGMSVNTLVKEGKITEEAAERFSSWKAKNQWKYSNVIDKWKNPRWDKFMRKVGVPTGIPYYRQEGLLRESTHPEALFYMFILDLADEADSKVPFSYRLGGRLPGVPKIQAERIKEGQAPSTIAKQTFNASFLIRPEDTERGDYILTDEEGKPKMFLPIHFVNQIELNNQSFDLPGIYFKFWESANDYNIKRQILPEIEMARSFVDTRRAIKRNSLDKIVMSKLRMRGKGNIDELDDERSAPSLEEKTQLAKQFGDWFEMAVYGKKSKPGSLWHVTDELVIDGAKFVDALNRYTSLSLLAFNMVQGAANVAIGEAMQAIDAFAHEHVSAKSLTQATGKYHKWLPGMMGDWGARAPAHVGSMIIEWANVLHDEVTDVDFSKRTKVGQWLDLSTAFAIQKAGEHWMQSRFLYAMLIEKRAYNSQGEDIGSMLDQYYAEDGNLELKKEVDLKKSNWTIKDQEQFKRKTKGLLSRMHGEYSDLGRVALQRLAVGRMAYMFRKFVVPGFKRRWGRSKYIQRLDQTVEGNYVTTIRFVNNLRKDLKVFKAALMSEEWAALSDHEKSNIRRALGETIALVSTSIIAGALFKSIGDEDEDDWLAAYWAYQAYRLQTELLFWTPKIDEAMTILRSPMASMSVIENTIKLLDQMWTPGQQYERGPWKGEYKIKKTLINYVPIYKQYYKMRDVEGTITFFKD